MMNTMTSNIVHQNCVDTSFLLFKLSSTTSATSLRRRRKSFISSSSLLLLIIQVVMTMMFLMWKDTMTQHTMTTCWAWQYTKVSTIRYRKQLNHCHHSTSPYRCFWKQRQSLTSSSMIYKASSSLSSSSSSSSSIFKQSSVWNPKSSSVLFLSTEITNSLSSSSSTSSSSTTTSNEKTNDNDQQQQQQKQQEQTNHIQYEQLIGIDWLQDTVAQVLNELFDYKEIAAGQAWGKINKLQQIQNSSSKKKNKKKNNKDDDEITQPPKEDEEKQQEQQQVQLLLTDNEIQLILNDAILNAKPFTRQTCMVSTATRSEFGDYQINIAMMISQSLKALYMNNANNNNTNNNAADTINPISVAQQIIDALTLRIQDYFYTPLEIAGPGFINMKYNPLYVLRSIYIMASSMIITKDTTTTTNNNEYRLGIPYTKHKQKIIVDYSSPNIAKEMHVGHLRSTIIGDTIGNVLEFCGHDVVRLNHIGDWGTQFGMLVEHLRDEYPDALRKETSKNVELGDLVILYKAAKKRFDVDDDFKQRARDGVVKLQAGNPEEIAAWESLCYASRIEYQKIYDLLNVNEHLIERGESFYNPYLADVVHELKESGLAVESEGATVVFLDGYTNRDGTSLPMIIQKSDGGYNYATTDLAAIRHRTLLSIEDNGEKADRVLYVTDAGQSQHFDMVFAAAKLAKFVPSDNNVSLEHVPFGLVQGSDGKKFATRSGDTVKLKDLLNEAVKIAYDDLMLRNSQPMNNGNNTSSTTTIIDEDSDWMKRIERVSQIVGIGAVKYADLTMNRESNYKFNYEKMLSLNGNTAPYMLYAYARICGIIRKATTSSSDDNNIDNTNNSNENLIQWPIPSNEIIISHESEYDLMRTLIKIPDVIYDVENNLYPNKICDYLFETSQKFNQFYENCSVNQAETAALKQSRLTLCTATAGTIRLLLLLLGIQVVEKL